MNSGARPTACRSVWWAVVCSSRELIVNPVFDDVTAADVRVFYIPLPTSAGFEIHFAENVVIRPHMFDRVVVFQHHRVPTIGSHNDDARTFRQDWQRGTSRVVAELGTERITTGSESQSFDSMVT